ncbi:MAG TPA: FAD-linked oxidase C-terminal domain-containing protein [Candidatus Sumerlaeota bacterium]|nr:FAD-linked oxidase C-terminal domain-containing protein [Candidatus Sumerlaeota bacterium]HPK02999.1 FAD-linked oxidase C-terminal domain-containing protein [Candidatus Sumerlaeota bacterium]
MSKTINLRQFEQDLRQRMRGEVYFDQVTRGLYSTDASIYQEMPIAVCAPRDEEDVAAALRVARDHQAPVLPRGGGTSLAGQAVATALVLDFSRYMNKILDLDLEQGWVRVQPGVVRDELNAKLAAHGMEYAPDPATANRANIGGMIGNNSSGTRSIIYGKVVDHILQTVVHLADGTRLDLHAWSAAEYEARSQGESREAEILRGFRKLIETHRDEIAHRFPKVMRRVGGYNLDQFIQPDAPEGWNLAKLVTGSEGTLATTVEARLNLVRLPRATAICVCHFADLVESIRAVPSIVRHGPSAVEILDRQTLHLARRNLSTAPLCNFIQGDPAAILIVEFFGDSTEEVREKCETLGRTLASDGFGYAWPVYTDAEEKAKVWNVRKNGLGLMLGMKGDRKPIPFIEDACVPVEVLPEYITQVLEICRRNEAPVIMYAHASVGVIHVRPILDLRRRDEIERMKRIAEEAFQLVVRYHGSWSSEHGDGYVRSPWMERFYGPRIYGAFKEVKSLFDPEWRMNPGKILEAPEMDHDLRYGTEYHAQANGTAFHYREDGGFARAVEMCTGVGACRKTLGGTMCPSYMATRDEEHSTRGRANALRLAMTGRFGPDGMTSRRMYEVFDLCLSCKGCKAECPSNVDVARLKSEFLQRYHAAHGTTLRDRLIRDSASHAAAAAGMAAPLVNWIQASAPFRLLAEKAAGIDRRRKLPGFALRTFPAWHARRNAQANGGTGRPRVVLFDDTYMNYHEPNVGRSAVELLEGCGYEVQLARAGCCQRPAISHGFLDEAREKGERTLRALDAYIQQGLPVLVCEPSCASALVDDLPDLIEDVELGHRVKENVMMIDVFLDREMQAGRIAPRLGSSSAEILVHGHCHQKALFGTGAMKRILGRVEGLAVSEVDSGCCGMAGSFGYEKEHYELSRRIAEDRLLPAIRSRKPGATIVACGFSCRHQIQDFAGEQAYHWVETVHAQT